VSNVLDEPFIEFEKWTSAELAFLILNRSVSKAPIARGEHGQYGCLGTKRPHRPNRRMNDAYLGAIAKRDAEEALTMCDNLGGRLALVCTSNHFANLM
jgi:hypothetical protein